MSGAEEEEEEEEGAVGGGERTHVFLAIASLSMKEGRKKRISEGLLGASILRVEFRQTPAGYRGRQTRSRIRTVRRRRGPIMHWKWMIKS